MDKRIFSIVDIKDDFQSFSYSFHALRYNVGIDAKMFQHHGLTDFTLEDLRSLFPGEDIQGVIKQIDFAEVKNKVRKSFSFISTASGEVCEFGDAILTKEIEERFWKMVNKFFSLPPILAYEYYPDDDSFDFYVHWHFIYVFLNKEQGLCIDAGAYD